MDKMLDNTRKFFLIFLGMIQFCEYVREYPYY